MRYLYRRTRRLIAEAGLSSHDKVPGANINTAYKWEYQKGGPILAKMASILDALGYQLEIVPKEITDVSEKTK